MDELLLRENPILSNIASASDFHTCRVLSDLPDRIVLFNGDHPVRD
jgi:hypothetical protein